MVVNRPKLGNIIFQWVSRNYVHSDMKGIKLLAWNVWKHYFLFLWFFLYFLEVAIFARWARGSGWCSFCCDGHLLCKDNNFCDAIEFSFVDSFPETK